MGHGSGKEAEGDAITAELIKEKQFLDYYEVGDRLGEGSFGVVYKCYPKGKKDKELAVKMVDKVETPADKIKEEAEFLRKMNHTNIIKCHDVINEKCFVCIVMDLFRGGDLIVCMQIYWKKGKIPYGVTLGLTYQMGSSLEYLHANNIIHRDVKADNYLCDRQDIGDPEVRIILTDFGTAKELRSSRERLHEKTGTKLYWSPEFYALDYSIPVDIWAMGVVVYGLISGSFPFKNKTEVNGKVLKWSKSVPDDVKRFALSLLDRDESKRASAASIISNPVLAEVAARMKSRGEATPDKKDSPHEDDPDEERPEEFREKGANTAIKDRRAELVDRMVEGHEKTLLKRRTTHHVVSVEGESGGLGERCHYWNTDFCIGDKRQNCVTKYEWWAPDRANAITDHGATDTKGMLDRATPVVEGALKTNRASVGVVGQMLKDHDINVDAFGKGEAKTLEMLASEIQSGAAVLMLDAANYKKLVRVVEFVGVRICRRGRDGSKEYLVETREKFKDGRERPTNRLPGTKKEPYENCKLAAERIVKTLCNLEGKTQLFYSNTFYYDKEEMSPSYPGVFTVYKSEIMDGDIVSGSAATEWQHVDPHGVTKYFKFMSEDECERAGIRYKAPAVRHQVSALVEAPLGLNEEELEAYLVDHKVDISLFGKEGAGSLEELVNEIQSGASTLMLDADGSVIRVADVVLIKMVNAESGKILIQAERENADKRVQTLNRFPGMKRRPDENQFLTAKKIIKRQLQINENHVTINFRDVDLMEEEQSSMRYPGLRTVYQKRVITATLIQPDEGA